MCFEAFLLVLLVTAAISSFLASLNSSDVFLYSNSAASLTHNVALHLISKLLDVLKQHFTALTDSTAGHTRTTPFIARLFLGAIRTSL